MVEAVGVEARAGQEVPVYHHLGLVLRLDVEHPLLLLVEADHVVGVLVGVFGEGLDAGDLLRGQLLQGAHGIVAEEQRTVDIDGGEVLVQDGHAVVVYLDARHLFQQVDGHFALVVLDRVGIEHDGVFLDGHHGGRFSQDGFRQHDIGGAELHDDLVLARLHGHAAPHLLVSEQAHGHDRPARRDVPDGKEALVAHDGIQRVFPRFGHDNHDGAGAGGVFFIFIIGKERDGSGESAALDALLGLEGKNGQNDCEQGGDSLHGYGSWFFAVPLCKNKASGRVRRPCQSNFTNYLYRKRLMLIFGVFSKGTSTVSTLAILL